MSQRALAEAIGVHINSIGDWEQGRAKPSFENIDKLETLIGSRLNVEVPQAVPELNDDGTTTRAKDVPPKARGTTKKKPGPKSKVSSQGGLSLAAQLEFPYHLLGNVADNRGLPATANALHGQAAQCAAAWDQFLMRYPALREKLEQGMVAQDIVILIMAHMPIVQTAQAELAARNAAMQAEGYTGGIGGEPTAA